MSFWHQVAGGSCLAVGLMIVPASVAAQQTGQITGRVSRVGDATPIAFARITVLRTSQSTYTDDQGFYRLTGLEPGSYQLRVVRIGFESTADTATVEPGRVTRRDFGLTPRVVTLPGVQVSALRPDLRPQSNLEQEDLERLNSRDGGELLRAIEGADAVRRGPMGLDPVIRGLRETEIGVYVDGTRMFPAGPARMDSPMSHYDPTSVRQMEVVKGPYALTWGAGNLSAIRVTTQDVFAAADRRVHGSVQSGYDGNLGAEEAAAELRARLSDHVYFAGHGAWRQGDDYTAGDGSIVPADYSSAEGRGKLGFELARGSRLTLSGGYQGQGALDNPGNLLDATYFHTLNLSSRWQLDRNAGTLRHFDVLGYVNNVRHAMNNDNKPTAQANANRIPPFPLDVRVTSQVDVAGGRVAAELAPERLGWRVELGGDGYRAYRNAVRTLGRRDNGTTIFEDLMWPQATIVDGGLFARGSKQLGQVSFSATVRADAVHANADTASQFFRDSVSTDLSQSELNLSGAATLSFTLSRWWSLSFGLGSVVRTADASERYSDRVPASKAQTSAEFVGTPDLKPERSNQADVWLEGSYQRVSIHLNAFARRIDDYITLTPTTLPKRLPLSPNTVYRYVNGSADFYGFEVSPSVALTPDLTVGVGASYLYGQDRTVDEPALGVTPFTFRSQLRLEPVGGRYYVEGSSHTAAKQDRVATSRGEVATPGYTTFDVRAGVRPWRALELRGGVLNVTDKFYVNHLNAKNPFTGMQLPEPGRVVFLEASVTY